MTTQSRKAKGRHLQKMMCAALLEIGKSRGLQPDDILSRSMGAGGVDVMLSPAAVAVFGNLAIECKNVETLNVVGTFIQHSQKYKSPQIPLLIHKRRRVDPLVTLRLSDYITMLDRSIRRED